MRTFKRRKFTRRFKRFNGRFKSSKGKFHNPTPTWKPSKSDQLTTSLSFKSSLNTSQSVPDRYLTWLTFENAGFVGGAVSAASYSFGLNNVVAPFGTANTGTVTIPNPFVAVATGNPAALKNLLFNATTSTGLWSRVRVWSVRVDIEFGYISSFSTGTSTGAAVHVGAALIIGTSTSYAAVTGLSNGPKSKAMTIISGTKPSMLQMVYSIPALLGVKKDHFSGPLVGSDQSFGTMPNQYCALQFGFATANGANLGSDSFTFRIRMQQHCEFYNRVDTALLQ